MDAENQELPEGFQSLVSGWIKSVSRSEDTNESYAKAMKIWFRKLGSESAVIACDQERVLGICEEWRKNRIAERTIRTRWMVLRSFVGWCAFRGLRDEPKPWKKWAVRGLRVDENRVTKGKAGYRAALTLKEARIALRWIRKQNNEKAAAILLMMVGGLRGIEVYNAKWADLDGKTLSIQGKGNKIRKVHLEPVVINALDKLSGRGGDIFSVCRRTIREWGREVWEVVGRSGEGASHGLRRTAATLLMEHGASLDQVQEVLGHSDIKTTARCYVVRKSKLTATTRIGGRK